MLKNNRPVCKRVSQQAEQAPKDPHGFINGGYAGGGAGAEQLARCSAVGGAARGAATVYSSPLHH